MNPEDNTNANGYGATGGASGSPNFETYDPVPEASQGYTDPNQAYGGAGQGYADPNSAYGTTGYDQTATGYDQSATDYGQANATGYDASGNTAYGNTGTDTAYGATDATTGTTYDNSGYGTSADPNATYADPNTAYADPNTAYVDPNSAYGTTDSTYAQSTDATGATSATDPATANYGAYTSDNIANSSSANMVNPTPDVKGKKKKSGKKISPLVIVLIAIVVVAVIAFVVIMLLPSITGSSKNNSSTTNNTVVADDNGEGNEASESDTILTCTVTSSADTLAILGNATAATQELVATYTDEKLDSISSTVTATYTDALQAFLGFDTIRNAWNSNIIANGLPTDPFTSTYRLTKNEVSVTHEATASELTAQSAPLMALSAGADGKIDTSPDYIQSLYQSAGYTCTDEAEEE